MRILVTGGAGFIGSHTCDRLLALGHDVVVLDALTPPVHRDGQPAYLTPERRLLPGRRPQPRPAREPAAAGRRRLPLRRLPGLPARLLAVLRRERGLDGPDLRDHRGRAPRPRPGRGGVVAVGDGRGALPVPGRRRADSRACARRAPSRRASGTSPARSAAARWRCRPRPSGSRTRRTRTACRSYGEEMVAINLGRRYGIPTVALRYSIVQGPRQSVYNAYSGACRIFCLSYLLGVAPTLYEDGGAIRDYVNIDDVVDANVLVLHGRPRRRAGLQRRRRQGRHDPGVRRRRQAPVRLRPARRGHRRVPLRRHPPHPLRHQRAAGSWAGQPQRTPADSVAAYAAWLQGHGRPGRGAGRGERADARPRRGPEGRAMKAFLLAAGTRHPAAADHRHHPEVHGGDRRPAAARHLARRVRPRRASTRSWSTCTTCRTWCAATWPARTGPPAVRLFFEPELLGSAGTLARQPGLGRRRGVRSSPATPTTSPTSTCGRWSTPTASSGAIATLTVFHSPNGRRPAGSWSSTRPAG